MKIDLTQQLKDFDGKDRLIEPQYNAQLLFQNIVGEVTRLWGKEKADQLVESLEKKQLTPEKATLKNIFLIALSRSRDEDMDLALKNYKMVERLKGVDEIDLGLEECERILPKVHKLFKDPLIIGQVKELTVDKFEKPEPEEPTTEPEPTEPTEN